MKRPTKVRPIKDKKSNKEPAAKGADKPADDQLTDEALDNVAGGQLMKPTLHEFWG
jgi:hypothetical protein